MTPEQYQKLAEAYYIFMDGRMSQTQLDKVKSEVYNMEDHNQ